MTADNKKQFDQNSQNRQELLEKYEVAFSGQLIEIAVGQSELKEMFDKHPEYQADKYDGMPSMKIAQKLGIISEQTSDALLILQAGARMVKNAQEMKRAIAGENVKTIKIDKHSVDFMNEDIFDARFKALKFGGSPQVVDAQASYAMSQVVLNELSSDLQTLEKIKSGEVQNRHDSEGVINSRLSKLNNASEVFAKYGSELIASAGKQLATEKNLKKSVASNVLTLSDYAMPENSGGITVKPIDFAIADIHDALNAVRNEFQAIGDHHVATPHLMLFIEESTSSIQNPERVMAAEERARWDRSLKHD